MLSMSKGTIFCHFFFIKNDLNKMCEIKISKSNSPGKEWDPFKDGGMFCFTSVMVPVTISTSF